ncbi:hypothetical protein ElyMa_002455400 [Elysia marginata]|uniref:Uncharacterized protein n=1 Tax=Elysia marginata TaxID=1093978 RepID=A0AAV4GKQ9_9GAST|nr:hypothetical protein ElyMa_002455400 [Elysia marginata]
MHTLSYSIIHIVSTMNLSLSFSQLHFTHPYHIRRPRTHASQQTSKQAMMTLDSSLLQVKSNVPAAGESTNDPSYVIGSTGRKHGALVQIDTISDIS